MSVSNVGYYDSSSISGYDKSLLVDWMKVDYVMNSNYMKYVLFVEQWALDVCEWLV